MRYTYFSFKNFKGIEALRFEFDRKPRSSVYTLVGLNESGKTTILEAMNFFSYGSQDLKPLELAGYAVSDVHDLIPIAHRANFNGDVEVCVGVELTDGDVDALKEHLRVTHKVKSVTVAREITVREVYPFKSSKHDKATRKHLWSLSIEGRTGNQRKARPFPSYAQIWRDAVAFLRDRMPRIWYFPNFLFEFPHEIYLEDFGGHSDTAANRHRFYRDIVQSILDALGNASNIEDHIVARHRSGDKHDRTALDGLLLEMGRTITRDVFGAWNEIFGRRISGKQVRLEVDQENSACVLRFRIEDADGMFTVSERSLGFRWFFVYLLITQYRAFNRTEDRDILFLLDEPASNLHSSAQAQLLRSFGRLAARSTVIYTTHSHHLINPDWLETTYVVRNAGLEYDESVEEFTANKTRVTMDRYRQFVSDHPSKTNYYQPILDVLEYRPSQLENVPRVVMVEGKNDYYLLNYCISTCLKDVAKIHFLPGGGAGSLDSVIQLYLGWGRDFIVLLDGDGAGTKARTRYTEKFGAILADRVFTLAEIHSTLRGAQSEGLFGGEERLAIQKLAYPGDVKYTKDHFNRAVQEALMLRKRVSLSDQTLQRIREVHSSLNERLDALSTA